MDIRHDAEGRRFVIELASGRATLDYERAGERTLDLTSTYVPVEEREHGVGAKLVAHVLDYARSQGFQVIPTCPFVARVIAQNREYQDLVARPGISR